MRRRLPADEVIVINHFSQRAACSVRKNKRSEMAAVGRGAGGRPGEGGSAG